MSMYNREMFDLINTWQFYLIAYLIANVLFFQFYKAAVNQAKSDGAATILLQLTAGSSILLLVPFMPLVFPTNPMTYLLVAAACIFYAINDRIQTTARKHLEVSVFSILNQFLTVFLIAYGFILFKEPITAEKILGAVFIFIGNILLLYKKGRFEFTKYTILSIIASLTLATAISIDIGISEQFNLPLYICITLIIPALLIAVTERLHVKTVLAEYHKVSFKYYVIAGAAWSLSIFFSLRSFQLGDVSLLVPLQATSVLLNVIVASTFHKERGFLKRKILAAALVIIGVYITTLAL
jgi:drug/metabolite transporter (DMT)-like permease